MTNLHKTNLISNPQIQINNQGGQLTVDGGMTLITEFLHKLHFDERKFCQHDKTSLLKKLLYQLMAGYDNDSATNTLQHDQAPALMLNTNKLASQPTISRFINSLTEQNIDEFNRLLLHFSDAEFERRNQQALILDVDSTHADTYGEQEVASYNSHYGTDGFHPILAFDNITGTLLSAKQRPGNVYTSRDANEFLRPLLKHYQEFSCDMNILIRGHSGFATLAMYELCDEAHCQF